MDSVVDYELAPDLVCICLKLLSNDKGNLFFVNLHLVV